MAKRDRQAGAIGWEKYYEEPHSDDESDGKVIVTRKGNTSSTIANTKFSKDKEVLKPTRHKVVVGVDFGTTYSGVAMVWAVSADSRDIEVIAEWPGRMRKNEHLEKVPSKIAYASENEGLKENAWGYEVEPGMLSYSWIKLLLDENANSSEYDSPHLQDKIGNGLMKVPAGKTGEEVAADYLRCLYKHLIARLEKVNGAAIMQETPICFWFTHPATWTDEAIYRTEQAAKAAGFCSRRGDELSLMTEPEAAALAILERNIDKEKGLYKVGTTILVADLGGGTLDFQCLKVTKLDPLQTIEVCSGEGGKSGAYYIDLKLHAWCENTFGDSFCKIPSSKTAIGSKFMDDFELVRKAINGKNSEKNFRLSLHALGRNLKAIGSSPSSYDFEDGEILISGADVERMFDPVITVAIKLIKNQRASLKSQNVQLFKVIALCGGLGSSEYIFMRLKEFCDEYFNGRVTMVTDERAWSAVVRGAVGRGLNGSMVLSKKAKRSYGLGIHMPFREGIDDEVDAFRCPIGGKRAGGYVDFSLLKKNQKITRGMKRKIKTYVALEADDEDDDLVLYWDLYTCAADIPELARKDAPGVSPNGKIKVDLRGFGKKKMKNSEGSTRQRAQKIEVNVFLEMSNQRGVLDVKAKCGRAQVGIAKIEYGK